MGTRLTLRRLSLFLGMALILGLLLAAAFSASANSTTTSLVRPSASESRLAPVQAAALSGAANGGDPASQVRRAWELSREAGKYAFATEMIETVYPALTLSNAGDGPDRNELHLEGTVDLPAQSMQLQLWQGAGSVATSGSGSEARIDKGEAFVRRPGGSWEKVTDFSANFAPDTDPLAYLAGMRNARQASLGEGSPAAAHYEFDLDGPALASYLRDQLEEQLRESGKLPLNVTIESSSVFRGAKGSGELWVDGLGLPMRLAVRLSFADQANGSHVDAEITSDFSGYPANIAAGAAASQPLAKAVKALGLDHAADSPASAAKTAGPTGALAFGAGAIALLIGCRRSRRMYAAVVIAVTLSMVVVPLMQSAQAASFMETQAKTAAQTGAGTGSAPSEPAKAAIAPWDPQQDPLQAPPVTSMEPAHQAGVVLPAAITESETTTSSCDAADTADPDGDGVSNYEECVYSTDATKADTDGDGLDDGQELNRLGTDPTNADTDGDQIGDAVEVAGFTYGGKQWYLNPRSADSNGDGVVDSLECPALGTGQTPDESCDTDGDNTPDLFDRDNDNDGVPDLTDVSEGKAIDRNGLRTGVPPLSAAFDGQHPFQLMVTNLQANWPVLVDLQVRPITTTHLAYALNVLDWPSNDRDGQIQHAKDTTFATSDNPEIKDAQDDPGSHGDMRLVPLLELTITGNEVPLKLTDPATAVEVRGALSATVSLKQQSANHANTDASFAFGESGSHDVAIYDAYCPETGAPTGTPIASFAGVTSGTSKSFAVKMNDVADGEHSLTVKQGSNTLCAQIGNIITGPYTDKMIDEAALAPYGVSVMEAGDGSLQAYLPLNVVSDDTGGGKTAFQTRMLYWPGTSNVWQEPEQARLVWAVNMITDECDAASFPTWPEYKAANPGKTQEDYDSEFSKHCETHRTQDQMQVVQTYDDSFFVTGVNVREDHGLDVAVSYPNPAKAYNDDDLWGLSWGLGQQFLPGQDCETDATLYNPGTCTASPDGLRDIGIFQRDSRGTRTGNSTISARFNVTSTVTGDARWGLSQDGLVVEDHRYDDQDYMAYLAGNVTPAILGKYDHSLNPTLLFAREERFRNAGLEGATTSSTLLTVNVDPATNLEKIVTGLTWAPYQYNSNAGPDGKIIGWEAIPGEEYWNDLSDELRTQFEETYPDDDAETIEGRMVVARAYYMALLNGVAETVEMSRIRKGGSSNDALYNATKKAATSVSNVTINVLANTITAYKSMKTASAAFDAHKAEVGEELLAEIPDEPSIFKSLGKSVLGYFVGPWAGLLKAGIPYQAAAVGLTVAAVTTLVLSFVLGNDTDAIGMAARALLAVNVAIALQGAVNAIVNASKAAGGFAKMVTSSLAGIKNLSSSLKSASAKAGMIGLCIQTIITWAVFFVQWGLGHMKAGSMALDNAAAAAIAATIAAVVLFVVFTALGPLGSLIKAIIGVIDAMVMLICNAFLTAEQQASKAGKWLCGGITGLVANLVKWWIYSGTMIVNLNPDQDKGAPWFPRVNFGPFDMELGQPERGIVTGNTVSLSLALTNTIDLSATPISPWEAFYWWQFDDDNLKKSTFAYKWQTAQDGFEDGLSLEGMSDRWLKTGSGRPFYITETVAIASPVPLTKAGINQPLSPLYLSEAYAAPEQECWGWFPYGGCGISTERSTLHYDIGSSLPLDVLPGSLDDFRQITWINGKYALAWGQSGDIHLPVLYDADSDGLSNDADVNDSKWDTDGDGLSDMYEQQFGSDPTLVDTDGDGLTDADEARIATNPRSKDSDGDGLRDADEVNGWEFVYGRTKSGTPLITKVYSDPNSGDPDADGLTDKQESTFGYNPMAPSILNVLTLDSQVMEGTATQPTPSDGYVKPGQTLYYTATVKNELDLRQAQGLLSTAATPLIDPLKSTQPKSFVLDALQSVTSTGTLGVSTAAASGAYSLTEVAGALITDWRTGSGGSTLWLRFDEATGATTYRDTSGSQPTNDGVCQGTGCSVVTSGMYANAVQLDGKSYVHSSAKVSASAYAVAFWFKASDINPSGYLFSDYSGTSYRALVKLDQGKVCGGVYQEWICTDTPVSSQQWHHVVHTYGGTVGTQKLYVDGRLVKSGNKTAAATTYSSDANFGGSADFSSQLFKGLIDDARLFDRALTADEVWDIAQLPVFHMDFEKQDGWEDVSPFHASITCESGYCPTHDSAGIQGSAARFNGTSFLNVAASPQFDLSGGKYTMSAWVYLESGCGFDSTVAQNQYIIGSDATDGSKWYPVFYATTTTADSNGALGTGFGTGDPNWDFEWSETNYTYTLPRRQWRHIVVTFDADDQGGMFRLYADGKQAWAQKTHEPGYKPYPQTAFQVGLSKALAYLSEFHSLCGKMDELMIYNRVLDPEAIAQLTRDGGSALHLTFDDAPGATAFLDSSAAGRQLTCSAKGCPTSGLAGRLNQAAQFTGNYYSGVAVALPNSTINRMANSFSVAAWIKPSLLAGYQRIISTATTASNNNGWSFGLRNTDLMFQQYGRTVYYVPGLITDPNRWYHLAAVMDPNNNLSLYVDGVLKTAMPANSGYADTDDYLIIGAGSSIANPIDGFNGLIDDVWAYGSPLTAAQVADLYKAAPVLHLPFEEANGKTSFADNARYGAAGTCSGDACPKVGEAVRGQVGLAAEFDGVNDMVTVPNTNELNASYFTVGAWIRPSTMPATTTPTWHEIITKRSTSSKVNENYRIAINENMQVIAERGCSSTFNTVTSATPVMADHWNHVMATFDGTTLRLYINGTESAAIASPGQCSDTAAVIIGGDGSARRFAGGVDEVVVYNNPLPAGDVYAMYNYQAGWMEDRQSQTIWVDNGAPTSSVVITPSVYLANRPVVVAIQAQDDASGVASVDLGVKKTASGQIAWSAASACTDPRGGPAWCAMFTPSGGETYLLSSRATDRLGQQAESKATTVYVDATAPALTLDAASGSLVNAVKSTTEADTWLVHLTGTAKDPAIGSGIAGSGVPSDGVRVTLRDSNGEVLGELAQPATLNPDGTWNIDYKVSSAEPDGCYTVQVEVVDSVARIAGLSDDQVAAHTTSQSISIVIDATAPQVLLNQGAPTTLATGQITGTSTSLAGAVSERPVSVRVDMTTSTGADKTRVKLSCQHPGTSNWYTVFDIPAGQLSATVGSSWEGKIHLSSSCKVDLVTTAGSGGVSGTVSVCGEQLTLSPAWVSTFSGSLSIPFSVQSTKCLARGCTSNQKVAGVKSVEVAFTSVLPGSAWLNEKPMSAEKIHLPFDDTPNQDGSVLVRDVSGVSANITCTGATCPLMGQPGHSNSAALFDGVDDAVFSNYAGGYDTTDTLAISVWIKPTGTSSGDGSFLARKSRYVVARLSDGTIRWAFSNQTGFTWRSTGYKAPIDQWTHLVIVYNAGVVTTYANGVVVHTYTTAGSITNNSWLEIGGYSDNGHFAGLIDDVRLINRAISEAEVKAIYNGSEPPVGMPMEAPLAASGSVVTDATGWGHDGTLRTGSSDSSNKTMTGEVGNYALKLDGVDDAVSIDNFGVFTTTTASAWIYRTGPTTVTGRETIVSYKEDQNCGFTFALEGQSPKFWVHTQGGWYNIVDGSGQIPVNQWVHLAVVHDGGHMRIYRNGQQVKSGYFSNAPVAMDQCTGKTAIGSRSSFDQHWFPGGIDDVRIYGRALNGQEILDLYNAGWHAASPSASGATTESASWTSSIPANLEGSYRIELRGADNGGHSAAVSARSQLWQGEVDNIKPRVTLCRAAVDATTYRYVTVAQDYNLSETGFNSPCAISSRTYFQSPWYLGTAQTGNQRLYEARAECQSTSTTAQATACDIGKNCVTVGLTNGGACDAILATTSAVRVAAALKDEAMTESPQIVIAPTVLTATRYSGVGTVAVTGYITGSANVTGVIVTVDGITGKAQLGAPETRSPFTTTWSYPWHPAGGAPDGANVNAAAQATVSSGPAVPAAHGTLTIDVVPPSEATLTLTSNDVPVQPGGIVRTASPALKLEWNAVQDGSGVAGYKTRWTATSAVTTTATERTIGPAGPHEDSLQAGEAQLIRVQMASRDKYGNERAQPFGSVLVDGPLTPDFVQIGPADNGGYNAWMDSGCTLLATDGRAARISGRPGDPAQKVFASWDEAALRLAWTGANWSADGDLFVYLDTTGGGATEAFTPYPVPAGAAKVLLPTNMAADRLVWVQDSGKAVLLAWNETGWAEAARLSEAQYRFDAARNGGETDLYLPFDLLGMSAGGSLSLLGFATEAPDPSQGLRIWATLPAANPVNSSKASQRAAMADLMASNGFSIPLLHYFTWASTGDGICPNGTNGQSELNAETQVDARLSTDPAGATLAGVAGGAYWTANPQAALAADVAAAEAAGGTGSSPLVLGMLNPGQAPLADGQTINYSVRIANTGSHDLDGAWLALSAYGSLRLLTNRLDLGTIPPGGEVTASFQGVTDLGKSAAGVTIALVQIYSRGHVPNEPALEWLVAANRVDQGAPTEMGMSLAEARVPAKGGLLHGYAVDESGVTQVNLEITGPAGGGTTLTCPLGEREAGQWSCQWDATAANGGTLPEDGAEFSVRLQATDGHGNVSPWSAAHTITVDALPPAITVSAGLGGAQRGVLRLAGAVSDISGVQDMTVCVDGECSDRQLSSESGATGWALRAIRLGASDFVSHTVTLRATDGLGTRMPQPQTFEVTVDNVAPEVTVEQNVVPLVLGMKETVLRGTATDGSPSVKTWVIAETPKGERILENVTEAGKNWSFDLAAELPGRYLLSVEATDLVGNKTTVGPFAVDVTCTSAALAVSNVTSEPTDGVTLTLTVKTTLVNGGPETLPAGVPVGFYTADGRLAALSTTVELPAGGQEVLTLPPWTVSQQGRYDLFVVPDDHEIRLASPVTFCGTPPTARAMIWAGPQPELRKVYMPVLILDATLQ